MSERASEYISGPFQFPGLISGNQTAVSRNRDTPLIKARSTVTSGANHRDKGAVSLEPQILHNSSSEGPSRNATKIHQITRHPKRTRERKLETISCATPRAWFKIRFLPGRIRGQWAEPLKALRAQRRSVRTRTAPHRNTGAQSERYT